VCRAGGEDLNAWLVSQGWALAYRHYSTAYVEEEGAVQIQHCSYCGRTGTFFGLPVIFDGLLMPSLTRA
jgi:hypothetical protein